MAFQRLLTTADISSLLTLTFSLGSPITVSGAASGTGSAVNLTATAHGLTAGSSFAPLWGLVQSVGGTTEANGLFALTVVDANHLLLVGTTFVHAYTSGGTLTVVTVSGGSVAALKPDDLQNLYEMTQRAPSAPETAIGTILAVTP